MTLERVEACPVCQGTSFTPFLLCEDYTKSHELFHVERCKSCGLAITNPRPTPSNAASYYQSENYISHTSKAPGFINFIYLIIRRFTTRWKLSLIKPYLKSQTVLDYGCGTGTFIAYCKEHGVNVTGVEPSSAARAIAQQHTPDVYPDIAQMPSKLFSVITMWHVLEHIHNLRITLTELVNHLEKDGTIFIAVPNFESGDAIHYRETWAAFDVPRHLWHFTRSSMTQLISQSGLKVKEVLPMKLDAYYISILSEKYRNNGKLGLAPLFRALTYATRSNNAAKSTGNYSSQIYVAQR